jgi:hypothetical protein
MSDLDAIFEALQLFVAPDQVTELRALGVKTNLAGDTCNYNGFFRGDELLKMARFAADLSGRCMGVYFTPNPLNPEIYKKKPATVSLARTGDCATDADVICRKWVMFDIDPVRPAETSSTDQEKESAWDVADDLIGGSGIGNPDRIVDSGNGYHLYHQIYWNDETARSHFDHEEAWQTREENNEIARIFLEKFDAMYSTAQAKIDAGIFNLSRIMRIPGTIAAKGLPTAERPHRIAKVLKIAL